MVFDIRRWRTMCLAALLCASCGGCQWIDWLVGNQDAVLNGGHRWIGSAPQAPDRAERARIWVRVRDGGTDRGKVRVLSSRIRRLLSERGWQVVEERRPEAVWLDVDVRYWGISPVNDRGVSVYAKLVRAHEPSLLMSGETELRGELASRAVFTPGAALISQQFSDVDEYVSILDLHLRQSGIVEEKETLVVWARRIGLGEQEAAVEISEQILAALQAVL